MPPANRKRIPDDRNRWRKLLDLSDGEAEKLGEDLLDIIDQLHVGRGKADYRNDDDSELQIPAGMAAVDPRLMKLSDAMLILYSFYAHSLSKGFATELRDRYKAIRFALQQMAANAAKSFLKKGILKSLGNFITALVQIGVLADAVRAQKEVAKRIRNEGFIARRQVMDAVLFGSNPRQSGERVATRKRSK